MKLIKETYNIYKILADGIPELKKLRLVYAFLKGKTDCSLVIDEGYISISNYNEFVKTIEKLKENTDFIKNMMDARNDSLSTF